MKKAYLVDFSVMTRVVVDDEKVPNDDVLYDLVIANAHAKVMKDISQRLLDGNPEMTEDLEDPYDPDHDE